MHVYSFNIVMFESSHVSCLRYLWSRNASGWICHWGYVSVSTDAIESYTDANLLIATDSVIVRGSSKATWSVSTIKYLC